jgi:hypothetical protein
VLDVNVGNAFQQARENQNQLDVHVFNVIRNATTDLITGQLWPWAPKGRHEVSHFAVLGFGPMAQTLVLQLARLSHFPNCKRSRFTIADRGIDGLGREFLSRYSRFTAWSETSIGVSGFSADADRWDGPQQRLPPPLFTGIPHAIEYVANARFVELPASLADERFAHALMDQFSEPGVKPVVFLCAESDRDSFQCAVRLRERLDCLGDRHIDGRSVPIFVALPKEPALAEVCLRDTDRRLIPFGDCQAAAALRAIESPPRDYFARKIHEAYESAAVERKKKATVTPWSQLPEHFRESNRQAADHLAIKAAVLGYRIIRRGPGQRTPGIQFDRISAAIGMTLSEMEHYRWAAERLLGGWRPAAAVDRQRKQHDCLVPWEHLSDEARQKDIDQVRVVLLESQKGDYLLVHG